MKGKILKVGVVVDGIASGWEFDCGGCVDIIGHEYIIDGQTVMTKTCCGYTLEELEAISKDARINNNEEDSHENTITR